MGRKKKITEDKPKAFTSRLNKPNNDYRDTRTVALKDFHRYGVITDEEYEKYNRILKDPEKSDHDKNIVMKIVRNKI